MEKVAGFGRVVGRRWIAAAAGCCVVFPLWAQQAGPKGQDAVLAEARAEAPVRLELNTSAIPRLESQDMGFNAPRVDLSLLPASRSGLGFTVGVSSFTPRPLGIQPFGATARANMDLGVHWRQVVNSNQFDLTAWRRVTPETDAYTLIQQRQAVYGARVEMNLTPVSKTGFTAERGFIGMQLQSGAKISIKRKNGGPMVYYRTSF